MKASTHLISLLMNDDLSAGAGEDDCACEPRGSGADNRERLVIG